MPEPARGSEAVAKILSDQMTTARVNGQLTQMTHAEKHAHEFGYTTQEEYQNAVQNALNDPKTRVAFSIDSNGDKHWLFDAQATTPSGGKEPMLITVNQNNVTGEIDGTAFRPRTPNQFNETYMNDMPGSNGIPGQRTKLIRGGMPGLENVSDADALSVRRSSIRALQNVKPDQGFKPRFDPNKPVWRGAGTEVWDGGKPALPQPAAAPPLAPKTQPNNSGSGTTNHYAPDQPADNFSQPPHSPGIPAERLPSQSPGVGQPSASAKVTPITAGQPEGNLTRGSLALDPRYREQIPAVPGEAAPGKPFLVKSPPHRASANPPPPTQTSDAAGEGVQRKPFILRKSISPSAAAPATDAEPIVAEAGLNATSVEASTASGAAGEGAATLGQNAKIAGAAGAVVLPVIFGAGAGAMAAHKKGEDALGILDGGVTGAGKAAVGYEDYKTATGAGNQTAVDRVLASGRVLTSPAVAAGSAVIGPEGPVAVGTVNLGLNVLQSVGYELHIANRKGMIEQTGDALDAMAAETARNSNGPCGPAGAHADATMYRVLTPLYDASKFMSQDPEIKGKMPAFEKSMARFNESKFGSTQQRLESGAAFARDLSKELRAKGPEGDAVRKAMAPSLEKAGVTADQYAKALDTYASNLEAIDARIKDIGPRDMAHTYAPLVERSAADLVNSMSGPTPTLILPPKVERQLQQASRPIIPLDTQLQIQAAPLALPEASDGNRAARAQLRYLHTMPLNPAQLPSDPGKSIARPTETAATQKAGPTKPVIVHVAAADQSTVPGAVAKAQLQPQNNPPKSSTSRAAP